VHVVVPSNVLVQRAWSALHSKLFTGLPAVIVVGLPLPLPLLRWWLGVGLAVFRRLRCYGCDGQTGLRDTGQIHV